MDRLTDGQFDGCGITMLELHLVEDSIVKTLQSTYHGRIAYPKDGEPLQEKEHEAETDADAGMESERAETETPAESAPAEKPVAPERASPPAEMRTN